MRISLLVKREPFGQILVNTLQSFWEKKWGRHHLVEWFHYSPSRIQLKDNNEAQKWVCNFILNSIFTLDVQGFLFDVIRKEYQRSMVRWKRPFQRIYVNLSLNRTFAPLFTHAWMRIEPGLPDAESMLIIAGNHKIRILNGLENCSYGIKKAGFPDIFIKRELQARKMAEELNLPVPELKEVASDESWFKEEYLVGTPINRLQNYQEMQLSAKNAQNTILKLVNNTLHEERLSTYVDKLMVHVKELLNANNLIGSDLKKRLLLDVDSLSVYILKESISNGNKILLSQTHGDFQPANILLDHRGIWIIDWEYSKVRQACFDPLVYGVQSRIPNGLARRCASFVTRRESLDPAINLDKWPCRLEKRRTRLRQVSLFLIEELETKLEEEKNQMFQSFQSENIQFLHEFNLWCSYIQ